MSIYEQFFFMTNIGRYRLLALGMYRLTTSEDSLDSREVEGLEDNKLRMMNPQETVTLHMYNMYITYMTFYLTRKKTH